MTKTVHIIGAGLSGLVAATELLRRIPCDFNRPRT